jgi:hypothetical protein
MTKKKTRNNFAVEDGDVDAPLRTEELCRLGGKFLWHRIREKRQDKQKRKEHRKQQQRQQQ